MSASNTIAEKIAQPEELHAAAPAPKLVQKVGAMKRETKYDSAFSSLIIPFVLVHLVALVAPFVVGISWKMVGLAVGLYYLRMASITIGYHRYFAHKTFKTSRAFQFVLAFMSQTSLQRGVLWWTAHHRDHHRYSDTEKDVHSPIRGFFWSHVGWILSSEFTAYDESRVKDLSKYPELRFLNEWHTLPAIMMALSLLIFGGWNYLVWGFFVSTVMLWHGTFLVNSANHIWGSRRYLTTDTSRNNPLIAVLTMGEGWHNNHHHYMASANQGFFWWEVDGSYYLIRLFQMLGLVWEVRTPPRKVIEGTIKAARARGEPEGAVPSGVLAKAE
jgi:stearoyl-CoA desaturase (delta-9 desaturase)